MPYAIHDQGDCQLAHGKLSIIPFFFMIRHAKELRDYVNLSRHNVSITCKYKCLYSGMPFDGDRDSIALCIIYTTG